MPDVTIVNVPEGAEEKVKEMAAVAIERFLRSRDLKEDTVKVEAFKTAVDDFRVANDMEPQFHKVEIEQVDVNEAIVTPSK